jgi:tetratricopeptide (TPR) repeat protein
VQATCLATLALAAALALPLHAQPVTSPAPAAVAADTTAPPASTHDLEAWIAYRGRAGVASLPEEARLFYRLGMQALRQRDEPTAIRMLRGACELDPAFLAPHLTLLGVFALHEPSQALLQTAAILDLARNRFSVQLALAGNALFYLIWGLFLGMLGAGLIVVALHAGELRHPLEERLRQWVAPRSARVWSWTILALPFVTGWGLALPTLLMLALLWIHLRLKERVLFVALASTLAGAPLLAGGLARFSLPMRTDEPPLYGVQALEEVPDRQLDLNALGRIAQRAPDNRFVQFALGWAARRRGDLALAEQAYRRTLGQWPRPDRVWNNLGNVLALQGRADEALDAYQHALRVNPANVAAHYNLAQIYTQRFDYEQASQEMAAASALDFELVRAYQSQISASGRSPLMDRWIEPAAFWQAALSAPRAGVADMPLAWRGHLESAGWSASLLALALVLVGLLGGVQLDRELPARRCSNCQRVVCRRCAVRQRERALCPDCARVAAGAESGEFARVLLAQHKRKLEHRRALVRTGLAGLIPGYGLLSFRHVFTPTLLLGTCAVMLAPALGVEVPFSSEAGVVSMGGEALGSLRLIAWALIYLVSLLAYAAQAARAERQARALAKPVSQRVHQVTRAAA